MYNETNILQISENSYSIVSSADKKVLTPENIIYLIIFWYSVNYLIKSKCFDSYKKSDLEEKYVDIKDIKGSNIDKLMCKIFLNILYSSWNIDFTGLRNEQFLDFIWFFYDLSCYSESDAIYIFYKNLLPFLFSYVADRSYFNVFRKPESEFSKYRK
ncbi:hypothetical protein CWI38_0808p0020 [Hamiltosporidium tvaerminnensis]|uniref:Uncharacterized protein n=2 Tax=Hamiltosporidium TaxID=1176354 RepID=A0A4Q9L619_9MICR|nr:hypothetical protein CWI37_0446p0030 [Hamiltosporidium tvaerminnensis]TBU05769.1 hypothetical protein CWI36_0581p0030 [Hamiltosporidium magnivora]TBU10285.1 hypothetical protein CWI38_1877p0030 [Hamiltosporidium tvaerminnensis]TBU12310.1 hypothetical protein CWI38_0808p0020 [Hamiltosporidium tvaerminnensis]